VRGAQEKEKRFWDIGVLKPPPAIKKEKRRKTIDHDGRLGASDQQPGKIRGR